MIDEEACWQAVQERDTRFNLKFVYGVRSTGVYCKPSCPSRQPRREQVVFFSSCDEAEKGGFRACRRCRPRNNEVHDPQVEMVLRACRIIESNTEGTLSLNALSEKLGVSPHHLHRTFKNITGITPRRFAAGRRIQDFKSRVKEGEEITSAMYEAGYGSSSRLYEKAKEELGMTPAAYRRGGKGMSISYTIVDCRLGRLLVAAADRGVCAVSFGDDDKKLESSLMAEYPAAVIRKDDADLSDLVRALLNHINGSQKNLDLPVTLQATAFQLRVWEELRKIPYGETRSYGEVAEAIGKPTATRAVARACATNPIALVTPCHRVIRHDGNLGGYRWGLERKKALLSHEQQKRKN
jgi:AraC family transcriptional regulator of adaptative response/methylated-DNA-[protein]-cysteine methyltransferase